MRFSFPRVAPPRSVMLLGACNAVLHAGSRVIYPAAALLVAEQRADVALWLLGLVLVLSLLRSLATLLALERLRTALYERLGQAIANFPALMPAHTAFERIEANIVRGVPWLEAHYAQTWPALCGSLLALPVVGVLTAREVGLVPTLVGSGVLLCALAVSATTARRAERAAERAWTRYQRIASVVEQGLRGRVELRVHGLFPAHQDKLRAQIADWSQLDRRTRLWSAVTGVAAPLSALALGLSLAQLLGLAAVPWLLDVIGAGSARSVGVGLLFAASLPLLFGLSRQFAQFSLELPYVEALASFLGLSETPSPGPLGAAPLGDVVLEHVEFGYPAAQDQRATCVRAHFTLRAGETVALLGPNGCGKTTVALGLIGAIPIRAGRVVSTPAAAATGAARIAYLSQGAYLDDNDSVRQSLQFLAPEAEEAALRAILQELGVADDEQQVLALLERSVGSLSSGQRRLLALGRVLLREADLLILDEPEANLGSAARARVVAALGARKAQRRMLILTHDTDIASVADRSLVFAQPWNVSDS